jgi:hypothetical protein
MEGLDKGGQGPTSGCCAIEEEEEEEEEEVLVQVFRFLCFYVYVICPLLLYKMYV